MAPYRPPSSPAHPDNGTRKLIQMSGMEHHSREGDRAPRCHARRQGDVGATVLGHWEGMAGSGQALGRPVQLVAAPACREGVGTRRQGLKQGLNPCHLIVPAPHHPTVPALREEDLDFPAVVALLD